jgi:hypothetical protein
LVKIGGRPRDAAEDIAGDVQRVIGTRHPPILRAPMSRRCVALIAETLVG